MAFFDLPLEEKLRCAPTNRGASRLQPFASKSLGRTYGVETPPDLREQFFVGPLDDWSAHFQHFPGRPRSTPPTCGPARRPSSARSSPRTTGPRSGWRAISCASSRWRSASPSAGSTTGSTGISAPVRPTSIPSLPGSRCRASSAPAPTPTSAASRSWRQRRARGPSGARPAGEWRDVRPAPGQLVVNLGDMMARWTNDRWQSAVHRVANPPREQAAVSRRQTVGFFLHPN